MPDINVAYQWAINTCNAPNVGYSQPYRNQQTVGGITYYDCSSFIWYALMAGGFDVVGAHGGNTWPFTTFDMESVLLRLGFQSVPVNDEWKSGDIGVVNSGGHNHTEMVFQGGSASGICMGAHTANTSLANQVSISSSISQASRWDSLWRYGEGGAEGYGYSIYVVSAICGNWWQESGINSGVFESLRVVPMKDNNIYGGFGFGQWTNSSQFTVYRRTALADWCDANGYDYDDPIGQIKFMMEEDYWLPSHSWGREYANLTEFFSSTSTDLEALTRAFLDGWEGIYSDSQASLRITNAKRVFEYINAHAQDPNINQWFIGNRYLSEAERLNNAVMLYRLLSTGGGGGKEKHLIHRMPVWMMARRFW